MSSKNVFLDVRTMQEFARNHVTGAIHFDVVRLLGGEMPNINKNDSFFVYCLSGARANVAVQILKANGFIHAENIGTIQNAMVIQ